MEARPEASIRHPSQRLWLHLLLVVLTLLSTFVTNVLPYLVEWVISLSEHREWAFPPGVLSDGVIFAFTLVAILGAHEMGHYVLARIHRVDTTLPFFIPLPMLGVGTLGAVIRIRSRIPTRNALVDIGAAGPLAGIAVAIPVILVGLTWSKFGPVPVSGDTFPEPWSIIGLFRSLPSFDGPVITIYGDNLLMKALYWLVLGPIPPGHDVLVHPMVIAGWFGLLVTMLNLIPIGQLDGGHLTHAWFGRRAETIGKVMSLGLLYLALFHSFSWVLWFFVTRFLIKFAHPPVVDEAQPLSLSRRVICVVCFVAFILCVMPVPLRMVTVP